MQINAISLACSHLIDNGGEWKVCLMCSAIIILPFIAFNGMPWIYVENSVDITNLILFKKRENLFKSIK